MLDKKRRVIEWLKAIPGGGRTTEIDKDHVQYRSWWPDHYRFEELPHLREESTRQKPTRWANGYLDGEYKEWYENGQMRIHSYHKDGRLHGECKIWNVNGKLEDHTFYNRGRPVEKIFVNAKSSYILVDGNYYPDD